MNSTTRSIALALGGGVLLVAIAANAAVALGSVRVLSRSFEDAERPHEDEQALIELFSAVQDAETGQRGYLLTGDPAYLEPRAHARLLADSLLTGLGDTEGPDDRVGALRAAVDAKLAELDQTVGVYDADGPAAALAVVRSGRGKRAMDDIRRQIDVLEAEADQTRALQVARAYAAHNRVVRALWLANGVLALVVLGLGLVIRCNLVERERNATALREINDSLSAALAEREAALARVRAMQAQLVQNEKMASMGRLSAGIAHEIKNPLNFVNNFADLSVDLANEATEALARGDHEEAGDALEDLRQNAAKIAAHGRRADAIVQGMLVHARGVTGDRAMTALGPLLDAAVEQALPPDAAPGVRVIRDEDPALEAPVVAQATVRLLVNLIQNAVYAVRERAGAGDPAFAPQVRVSSRRETDRGGREVAVVTVEDNGAGVPDELLPRIFEPFFTTKGPGAGTGLGLSLAYDIAVGHSGSLLAGRSALGGAAFTLTLPLDAAEADAAA